MSAAALEHATRLLAHEAALGGGPRTTTATRTYDKLLAQVAPLIGTAGAELLFVRSAKMQRDDNKLASISLFDGAAPLRASLQATDPPTDATVALVATFLALLANFIGERLTAQVVHRAWPDFDTTAEETP